MDLQECLAEISKSIDAMEEELNNATCSANEARNYADSASSEAYSAQENAEAAEAAVDEALGMLSTLRDEYNELVERIEELTVVEDEDGEKSVHLSDLQKDIAKHKVKVLKLKENAPRATAQQIAEQLGIGEFLVRRILELHTTQAA